MKCNAWLSAEDKQGPYEPCYYNGVVRFYDTVATDFGETLWVDYDAHVSEGCVMKISGRLSVYDKKKNDISARNKLPKIATLYAPHPDGVVPAEEEPAGHSEVAE